MTANAIATTATDKIARMTTAQLLDAWREIDAKPMTNEVATVRGWLMDALEARNPEAFAAWMEQYDLDDPTPLFLQQFTFTHKRVPDCKYTATRDSSGIFAVRWDEYNGCPAGRLEYGVGEVAALIFLGEWIVTA